MSEQELTDLFARKDVEPILSVEKLIRAWLEQTLSTETTVLHMLYNMGTYEEDYESNQHRFVDLERRHAQMSSEIVALRQELGEVKAGLR